MDGKGRSHRRGELAGEASRGGRQGQFLSSAPCAKKQPTCQTSSSLATNAGAKLRTVAMDEALMGSNATRRNKETNMVGSGEDKPWEQETKEDGLRDEQSRHGGGDNYTYRDLSDRCFDTVARHFTQAITVDRHFTHTITVLCQTGGTVAYLVFISQNISSMLPTLKPSTVARSFIRSLSALTPFSTLAAGTGGGGGRGSMAGELEDDMKTTTLAQQKRMTGDGCDDEIYEPSVARMSPQVISGFLINGYPVFIQDRVECSY
ncbi:hypothetical protein ZWY2020_048764 [Hordeum vulgare]|nr:hypothetical protein ZWY2020_048764 [Hordeum vulgare]